MWRINTTSTTLFSHFKSSRVWKHNNAKSRVQKKVHMLRWHSIPSVCSVQVYWHYNQQKKRNTSPARCLCVCVLPFFSPLHSLYLVFLLSKYVHSVHTSYSSQNWILHLACIAIPKFASVTTEKTMAFINPISSLRTSAQRVLLFSFDQAFFFPLLLLPSQYSVCI